MTERETLELMETETLEIVVRDGRDPMCVAYGCRMTGKKCPEIWCETIYQHVRAKTQAALAD